MAGKLSKVHLDDFEMILFPSSSSAVIGGSCAKSGLALDPCTWVRRSISVTNYTIQRYSDRKEVEYSSDNRGTSPWEFIRDIL